MKRTETKAGVPDVFLPVANKIFHGLWIEFKSEAEKLSQLQKDFATFLEKQNYKFLLCREWQAAANAVIDYLNLPLRKIRTENERD